nr:N-acetylmannosamine-6-phosphate 2-epimerase [Raoultella sp. NCTC 9187]
MPVAALLARIHQHNTLAMTDCSSPEDGLSASGWGRRLLVPRCRGYTGGETPQEPDLALVRTLHAAGCRVIAEGRYNTPEQAGEAMRNGAWAVTVGSAITRLEHICEWYNAALKKAAP